MLFFTKKRDWKLGLVPAAELVGYVGVVATIMTNGDRLFGKKDLPYLTPVMVLLLFVVSALVCTLLVLGKPYQLFVDKRGKEALQLVVATTKWLAVFLIIVMGIVLIW